MLGILLPRQASNDFAGHRTVLWILGLVLLLLTAMSANSIFNGRYVATQVDGLPLDSYTSGGAQAVLSFYATWGVTQLFVVAFGVFTLLRYRSLAPLALLVLLAEQMAWRIVDHVMPVAKQGGSGGSWFVYGLLVVTLIGFVFALWKRPHVQPLSQSDRVPRPLTSSVRRN